MNRPPLIVHIIFRLDFGGLENGLVNLINNMPADKYRHAIICMTETTEFSRRIKVDGVQIFELHKKEGQDFSIYPKMMRIFREIRPDIVHSKNFGTIEAQLISFLAGVKYRVHSEHGRDVDDIDGKNRKRIWIRRILLLFTLKCIPLSKNLESWLLDTIKVPKRKITQLYNGVDVGKFNVSQPKACLRGFPPAWENRIIIGVVGRLQPVKNQKMLLLAFSILLKRKPNLRGKLGLAVIGDGPEREQLEKIALLEGIVDCVWFAGARNDIKEVFGFIDIFVLPSLNEGISNTILEAMASGLPVIATNVGGNPELVDDNHTGILSPSNDLEKMADALLLYVNNMELAAKHGAAGRKRVEAMFSMDKMIENYTRVYDSLML